MDHITELKICRTTFSSPAIWSLVFQTSIFHLLKFCVANQFYFFHHIFIFCATGERVLWTCVETCAHLQDNVQRTASISKLRGASRYRRSCTEIYSSKLAWAARTEVCVSWKCVEEAGSVVRSAQQCEDYLSMFVSAGSVCCRVVKTARFF